MEHIFVKEQFKPIENIDDLSECLKNLQETTDKIFNLKAKYDCIGFIIFYVFSGSYIFTVMQADNASLGFSIIGSFLFGFIGIFPFYITNHILNCFQWRQKLNNKFFNRFTNFPKLNFLEKNYTTVLEDAINDQNFQYKIVSFLQKISESYTDGTYKGKIDNDLRHIISFFNKQDYSHAKEFIIEKLSQWKSIKAYISKTNQEQQAYDAYMVEMKKNTHCNEETYAEHGATINLKSIL